MTDNLIRNFKKISFLCLRYSQLHPSWVFQTEGLDKDGITQEEFDKDFAEVYS